ncbi:MAG TPA: hypothetical protein VIO84_15105 [Candidatus Dormibacteraeota bacterium]|jgi:hypothetical protein
MGQRAPSVTRWLALLLLLAAGVVLVWTLGSAFTYTLGHPGPPCPNPPQRQADPPQGVVVLLCVAGFVIGHLTSRWQLVESTQQGALETGSRQTDAHEIRQLLILQAILLLFLLEVVGLLVIQVVTLSRGAWPITYYVRCAYDAAGWPTTAAATSITFLVGRWFWLPVRSSALPRP